MTDKTNGILRKSHPKSKIDIMHWKSKFYPTIKTHLILQVLPMSEDMVVIEWLENEEDLYYIYGKDN